MCDQCAKIYKTDKKHDPSVCPIALSLTCSCCKTKGHTTLKCPNLKLWRSRVPEYIEQLIPFELRVHHKIPFDQKTPISTFNVRPPPCSHVLADQAKERIDRARDQIKGIPVVEKLDSEPYCNLCRPVLEIPEDKDGSHTANIRATLASNNMPNSTGKENLRQLTNFAAMNGKKLILMKNIRPVQKDDTPPEVSKKPEPTKEIKCKPAQGQAQSPQSAPQDKPKKTLKRKAPGKAT